jgi:cytosine/adenosine deaminase-related metal-dependent hydrolase
MCKAIDNQIVQGVSSITTFLDFDKYSKDKPWKAFLRAKDKYYGKIELYSCNQTLEGVIDSESRDWFYRGSELVDYIGGLPGREKGNEEQHLNIIFNQAEKLDKKLFIHVDQFSDPSEIETELVLNEIESRNFENKVALIHLISLNCHNKEYREYIYKRIENTKTSIICSPRIWLDRPKSEIMSPIHNPITPISELINYNIKIGISTDNILDILGPFSDGDMYQELVTLAMCNRIYNIDKLVKIGSAKI